MSEKPNTIIHRPTPESVAEIINEMRYGDLIELAVSLRDVIEDYETVQDAGRFAAVLYSWANYRLDGLDGDNAETPHV